MSFYEVRTAHSANAQCVDTKTARLNRAVGTAPSGPLFPPQASTWGQKGGQREGVPGEPEEPHLSRGERLRSSPQCPLLHWSRRGSIFTLRDRPTGQPTSPWQPYTNYLPGTPAAEPGHCWAIPRSGPGSEVGVAAGKGASGQILSNCD